jgi:PPOX class probable F420-dependent enzyme
MAIFDEKYVLLTTFKRDGTPVSCPVWEVPLGDGKLGFWTSSGSGKAKRLAHTSKVTIQPCNGRGKVKEGSTPIEATAVVVSEGPEFDAIKAGINEKYGLMTKVTRFLNKIGNLFKRKNLPYGDRGVVITPSS